MELTPAWLARAHYWMRLTRQLDDRVQNLHKQSKIAGGCFSQLGHEAISVGAALALGPDDVVAPMHRDLGAYLVRGITVPRFLAQVLGREGGVTRGRDGNLHGIGDMSLGISGFISHLPASMPVTVGMAHAFALKGEARVAMTWFGDGSSSQGLCHEAMNWASVFRLPVIFICENNQYAYSTPLSRQMNITDIADRAASYGFPGVVVDGNDILAVYEAAVAAVGRARAGGGPTLIECKTMRMRGHAIHDNMAYVPPALLDEWRQKDPLLRFEAHLREHDLLDDAGLADLINRVEAEIDAAQSEAEASPYPAPETVTERVYAV
ncbi:MAG: thiamine pyrophosphate-dependent dehydrogenase E1 component subunit alpha [Chloroflexaceae bacterium]|jgi:pyruvate dehydrogenase E1 component alpha subunit|nr:thiamine pyrophosphate-dependent dehydrogenase E1 component subunit alpha [Chloroflexaceae bacterium]